MHRNEDLNPNLPQTHHVHLPPSCRCPECSTPCHCPWPWTRLGESDCSWTRSEPPSPTCPLWALPPWWTCQSAVLCGHVTHVLLFLSFSSFSSSFFSFLFLSWDLFPQNVPQCFLCHKRRVCLTTYPFATAFAPYWGQDSSVVQHASVDSWSEGHRFDPW